jgi:hypothetical protein
MLRDCQQLVYTALILPSRSDRWGILYRTVLVWTLRLYKNLRQFFFKFGTSYVLSVCSFLTKGHVLDFGRWITWSSWRTSLLCMWGGKGRVVVLFRQPICCRYYCISDSASSFVLETFAGENWQMTHTTASLPIGTWKLRTGIFF